jgi:lipopolysaccharide biosynthesis glycosyltransferase
MEKEINILFCTDTNYVIPLLVCLTSIFENNSGVINVYIFHSFITQEQKDTLLGLNRNIFLIEIDKKYFKHAPVFSWSKEAYYRLLINEYLPKDLDRILYLDCDTVVDKPLLQLYNLDLNDCCIAATEKLGNQRSLIGLPAGSYFVSGVILFDLIKCRNVINYEKILKIISSFGKKDFIVDESIINIIFDGKIKRLQDKYNDYSVTNFNNNFLDRLLNRKVYTDETCIFHFTNKPWYNFYSGSCEDIWYKYLKMSPCKDLIVMKKRSGIVKSLIFIIEEKILPVVNKLTKIILGDSINKKLRRLYFKEIQNQ